MTDARRRSEADKLQAIMNALLLPAAAPAARGVGRIRAAQAGVAPAAEAAIRPAPVETKTAAVRPAPARRGPLFLAPIDLGDAPAGTDAAPPLPKAPPDALPSRQRLDARAAAPPTVGPTMAARGRLVLLPPAEDVAKAAARIDPEPGEASRRAPRPRRRKPAPREVASPLLAQMTEALVGLTRYVPPRQRSVPLDAPGAARRTTQRGRAGKLPKSARNARTAAEAAEMAMRDARRLARRILAARAEGSTKHDLDALRADLVQLRRRCESPPYAAAMRAALPVALPDVLGPAIGEDAAGADHGDKPAHDILAEAPDASIHFGDAAKAPASRRQAPLILGVGEPDIAVASGPQGPIEIISTANEVVDPVEASCGQGSGGSSAPAPIRVMVVSREDFAAASAPPAPAAPAAPAPGVIGRLGRWLSRTGLAVALALAVGEPAAVMIMGGPRLAASDAARAGAAPATLMTPAAPRR